MNFDFTTSGLTVAAITFILWLFRNWIVMRLKESINHEYNRKIEDVRSKARQVESKLEAQHAANQSQIEALRNGVLSNISIRQTIKFEKKLEAAIAVWESVTNLHPLTMTVVIMGRLDQTEVSEKIKQGGEKKANMLALLNPVTNEDFPDSSATIHRPFMSPFLYSLAVTYRFIVGTAHFQARLLARGDEMMDINMDDEILKLGKLALPSHAGVIDKYGFKALCSLLDKVEEAILLEIDRFLEGEEDDKESISRAHEMTKMIGSLESNQPKD